MAAVVKASYTRTSGGAATAKGGSASLKYFAQRPDHQGQIPDRDIVTREGVYNLSHDQSRIEEKLQAERGQYLYRVVMSSGDQNMTQRQTERWAEKALESRGIDNYMLVAHAGHQGHTSNPHVHVLIPSSERLSVNDLSALRDAADQQYKVHQYQESQRLRLVTTPEDGSQQIKSSGGGKEIESDVPKPERKRENDYQLGR